MPRACRAKHPGSDRLGPPPERAVRCAVRRACSSWCAVAWRWACCSRPRPRAPTRRCATERARPWKRRPTCRGRRAAASRSCRATTRRCRRCWTRPCENLGIMPPRSSIRSSSASGSFCMCSGSRRRAGLRSRLRAKVSHRCAAIRAPCTARRSRRDARPGGLFARADRRGLSLPGRCARPTRILGPSFRGALASLTTLRGRAEVSPPRAGSPVIGRLPTEQLGCSSRHRFG
jgi:hypothetical protein